MFEKDSIHFKDSRDRMMRLRWGRLVFPGFARI